MKLISWNVNGIRSVYKKGFFDFIDNYRPDIICLQEIKTNQKHSEIIKEVNGLGYYDYWNFAEKKGYSGVAIFAKIKPINWKLGIGNWKFDKEGRILTLEFDHFFIINAYFPHSTRELKRLDYKLEFNNAFLNYSKKLMRLKPKKLIIAGDLNVAHREIDLANPKQNIKNAGFTPEERVWMDKFLALGLIDTFREFTKDGGHYTWWTWRANARERNIGWRIDYFLISQNLRPQLKSSKILPTVYGSDHCPVIMEMNI